MADSNGRSPGRRATTGYLTPPTIADQPDSILEDAQQFDADFGKWPPRCRTDSGAVKEAAGKAPSRATAIRTGWPGSTWPTTPARAYRPCTGARNGTRGPGNPTAASTRRRCGHVYRIKAEYDRLNLLALRAWERNKAKVRGKDAGKSGKPSAARYDREASRRDPGPRWRRPLVAKHRKPRVARRRRRLAAG